MLLLPLADLLQSVGARIRVTLLREEPWDLLRGITQFLAEVCFSVLLQRQESLSKQEKPLPERYAHMNVSASRFYISQHVLKDQVLELDVVVKPSHMANDRYSSQELVATLSHAVSVNHSSTSNEAFQMMACLWPWSVQEQQVGMDRMSWQDKVAESIKNCVFFVPVFTERYLNSCAAGDLAAWRTSAATELKLALSLKSTSFIVPVILDADVNAARLDERVREMFLRGFVLKVSRGSLDEQLDRLHEYLSKKLPEEKKQETNKSTTDKAQPYLDFLN